MRKFSIYGLLMSIGFIRKLWMNRELRRMELENYKHDLKVEFATLNQDHWCGSHAFYRENPKVVRMVEKFGIPDELPTSRDCRIFLYGEDINETIESCVQPVKQMPNSVEVVENDDGSKSVKVIAGERFYYFSPFEPAFNSNYTKFLWNGIVYIIPKEYYGMVLNKDTMRNIARDIIATQDRLITDIDGEI